MTCELDPRGVVPAKTSVVTCELDPRGVVPAKTSAVMCELDPRGVVPATSAVTCELDPRGQELELTLSLKPYPNLEIIDNLLWSIRQVYILVFQVNVQPSYGVEFFCSQVLILAEIDTLLTNIRYNVINITAKCLAEVRKIR